MEKKTTLSKIAIIDIDNDMIGDFFVHIGSFDTEESVPLWEDMKLP
jgi:hypothetical protein